MKLLPSLRTAALSLLIGIGGIAAASAATPAAPHPLRAEVHHRAQHQMHRIVQELRHGKITAAKAVRLEVRDHKIKIAEHRMVRHNRGHLTKLETARLNHRENLVAHKL